MRQVQLDHRARLVDLLVRLARLGFQIDAPGKLLETIVPNEIASDSVDELKKKMQHDVVK